MNDEEFLRQRDILTPEMLEGIHVDIVGGGSLGGAILFCLCKMGWGVHNRVTVTDFDICQIHNLPNQWFRKSHCLMERPKVEALTEMAALLCDRQIFTHQEKFTGSEDRPLGPLVILAVDSIEERTAIWKHLRNRPEVEFLCDPRMGSQVLEIHSHLLRKDPAAAYEETLHSADQSFEEPCTERAIMYTAFGAAAFVGSILRSYVCGLPFPRYLAFDFEQFFLDLGAGNGPAAA